MITVSTIREYALLRDHPASSRCGGVFESVPAGHSGTHIRPGLGHIGPGLDPHLPGTGPTSALDSANICAAFRATLGQ